MLEPEAPKVEIKEVKKNLPPAPKKELTQREQLLRKGAYIFHNLRLNPETRAISLYFKNAGDEVYLVTRTAEGHFSFFRPLGTTEFQPLSYTKDQIKVIGLGNFDMTIGGHKIARKGLQTITVGELMQEIIRCWKPSK